MTAELKPASTIIPVRETSDGLEIYLLKRNEKSNFMGGFYVFPGGMVDSNDTGFDEWESHLDVDRQYIEKALQENGYTPENALGFGIAAIRETLEEAGVFLASGPGKAIHDIEEMARFRLTQDLKQSWFKKQVMADGWVLSLSSLKKWSHWITPAAVKKRFDTFFFIAWMPEDQTCRPDMRETQKGIWITPFQALEKNLENEIPLSPPTITTLTQLLEFKNLKELNTALTDREWPDAVMPRAVISPKGPMVLMPWDPDYQDTDKNEIPLQNPEFLKPGRNFSRVLNYHGAWKPVKI